MFNTVDVQNSKPLVQQPHPELSSLNTDTQLEQLAVSTEASFQGLMDNPAFNEQRPTLNFTSTNDCQQYVNTLDSSQTQTLKGRIKVILPAKDSKNTI